MRLRPTPETDCIVRNAANNHHPTSRLAATLTVKCEKLERERDEARDMVHRLRKQRAIARNFGMQMERERDKANEALRHHLINAVNASCSCGGRPITDRKTPCQACEVWHRFVANVEECK